MAVHTRSFLVNSIYPMVKGLPRGPGRCVVGGAGSRRGRGRRRRRRQKPHSAPGGCRRGGAGCRVESGRRGTLPRALLQLDDT